MAHKSAKVRLRLCGMFPNPRSSAPIGGKVLVLTFRRVRSCTRCFHVTNVLFSIFAHGRMMSLLDIETVLAGSCGGTAAGRTKSSKLIFTGLGAAEASFFLQKVPDRLQLTLSTRIPDSTDRGLLPLVRTTTVQLRPLALAL